MWRMFGKYGEITPHICKAGNFGDMITAAQCRSARTLLSWSLSKLASAASVPESVIDSFELERQQPDAATLGALQRAFEDVGVVFLPHDDVRVRAASSPDS
jgi:transcriptional regulator with XRE-family HTH domain